MEYNESEFLFETEVPAEEAIFSRTDLQGNITFVNDIFCEISGYEADELIGKPHNLLRHPDMPSAVFSELWKTLHNGEVFRGVIKNLRRDKGYYWVEALVSECFRGGELVGYKSIRYPISRDDKIKHQKLYDKMRKENGEKTRKITYEGK